MACDHGRVPDRPPQLPTDRVAAELRARITAGEWAKDEQLPSVATLAEQHNTSRATMSRAIQRLADEGLVRVVPSWGTFRT
jgi:DNA-binding GntR family transcriptional regulator